MFRSSLNILILIVALANSALLPDYFKKCNISNPNLNKCLTKNAIEAWPSIVEGDKNVHLQPLDPLYITYFQGTANNKLFGNFTNSILTGLADIKIDEIKLDHDKQIFDLYFLIPRFNIWGAYYLSGEVINLPLEGKGIANATLYNLYNHLQIKYELIKKNDEHYIEPIKHRMVYNTTLLDVNLDTFGNVVNQILKDNWESLNKEITEAFGEVFGEIFTEVLRNFFKKVSFEKLFSK